LCLLPLTVVMMFYEWQRWRRKVLLDIEVGFKEWLYYIKSGLSSGKSAEGAILFCRESFTAHIGVMHPIQLGLEQFYRNLNLHIPSEECMRRFGTETELDAIEDFAVVFAILQRQGGKAGAILEKSIRQIYDRIELRQEIYTVIAAKQLEQRIMCTMPFVILFFVGKAGGGYFDGLYHNVQGVCIMTVCMMIYLLSVRWGQKMTELSI